MNDKEVRPKKPQAWTIPAGFCDDTWMVTYKRRGSAYDPETIIVHNLQEWVKVSPEYYVTYAVKMHDGFKAH